MNFRRIWSLSIKEFIHLRNDWWLPAFMLIGGAMELLLVAWATSRPITNLPMMVLDQDKSPASRQLVIALENTGTFRMEEQSYDVSSIVNAIDHGQINAALIIPSGFATQLVSSNGQPQLSVVLNGAESIPATEALRAIEGLTRDLGNKILIQRLNLDPGEFAGFEPSLRVRFNEELKEALYTTPAELALMLEFTVMLFAALAFSRERELGTLEQLLVMPFSSLEIIIGKSIPVIIIGYLDFLLMLGMVNLAFGVPIRGSLGLLLIIAFGYIFVELGKGMVISVFSKSQHQAFLLVLLVGMVDFMFTGYAAPVEGMPKIIQFFANFIPANHWLSILRGILIKGANLAILWPHILALVLLGIAISTISWRFIRRALD
ncbi:MAG: ABC transporter permease [Anaerolineales bacterium]